MMPSLPSTSSPILEAHLAAHGPLEWLQRGRTPIARTAHGILRGGTLRAMHAEAAALQALPPPLRACAPDLLSLTEHGEYAILNETDLGTPLEDAALDAIEDLQARWPEAVPEPRTGTLRALLSALPPLGGANPTPLIRALRAARHDGHPLPFRPDQQRLQRALDADLGTVIFSRGWSHGALHPARVLSGGLCHWRHATAAGHREADRAPFLSPEAASTAERLYLLKRAWSADPLLAADVLAALVPDILSPPETVTLTVARAHPGLSRADVEVILGAPLGQEIPATVAARALGRANGLDIAGVPLLLHSSAPIQPRAAVGFRQPRGRSRTRLFSRWAEGIRLDEDPEARASLTPEAVALAQADRLCRGGGDGPILDAFCGAGGNAIALARRGAAVVATDTSAARLELAAHNARLYGVAGRITFQQRDFFAGPLPGIERVFLDPPWAPGAAFLDQVREAGARWYRQGMLKLPRTHPLPASDRPEIWHTPEGFPAFLTISWGGIPS